MDFGEVIPTSDDEEEELELLDDVPRPEQAVPSEAIYPLLPPEPHTPSKRHVIEEETPRKRRKVADSARKRTTALMSAVFLSKKSNILEGNEDSLSTHEEQASCPPPIDDPQRTKHPPTVVEGPIPAVKYQPLHRPPSPSLGLVRMYSSPPTILEDVSNLSADVASTARSTCEISLKPRDISDLQSITALEGLSLRPALENHDLPSSSLDDDHPATPSLPAPHTSQAANNAIPPFEIDPPRPTASANSQDKPNILPSPDPLNLFASQREWDEYRTPSPPESIRSTLFETMGLPDSTPLWSPTRLDATPPPAETGPSSLRHPTPRTSPSSSPPLVINSPPPEIPPEGDLQPRRQLRPRTAAQTRPYTVDMVRYKRQIRNIPGAYEPMPEVHRRRRSPVPGTFDERDEVNDPDVTPMDLDDEELSEGEMRRRRRRKSGSPGAQQQRSRTIDSSRSDGDPGPSRRILKPSQKQKSPPRRPPPISYPSGLQSLSSSSDDDELIALARPAAKPKPSDTVPKSPKRKRPKPFPLKRKPPIEETPPRPQKDPTPPSSPHVLPNTEDPLYCEPISPFSFFPPMRLPPISDDPPEDPYDDFNFLGDDGPALPSELDIPPSSSHASSIEHHDFNDLPLNIDDSPINRPDSVIDLADSSDHDPQRLSNEVEEEGNTSESSGSSTDSETSRLERKRMKILKRMMPGRWILEQQKKAKKKRLDRANSPSRDLDDDGPLQPGQSRVRKATQFRSNLEIRGDSESSDIEIPQSYPGFLHSPSPSRSPSPLPSRESGSESDVGDFAPKGRHYTINLISSDSEQGDDESISRPYDAESDPEAAEPSRPLRWYMGEAQEDNLIDRMLSRSHASGPRKAKAKRQSTKAKGKTKRSSTGQPRLSKNALDVTVGGSRRHSKSHPHQTKLPFSRHSSSRKSFRMAREDVYDVAEPDVLEISDNEEGQSIRHKLNPITAADVLKRKVKEKEKEKGKGKAIGTGVFVLDLNTRYLTTGRSHQPYTIAAEDEVMSRTTIAFPDRHGPSKKKKKRHKPPAKGSEMPLDLIWQRITDPKAAAPGPLMNEPVDHRVETSSSLHQVELDCGIQLLPSGISFGRSTYLGKGRLQALLAPPAPLDDASSRPNPCVVFELHITSYAPAHEFRGVLERLVDNVIAYISDPTRSLSREDYHDWQKALGALCQHLTWFLAHSDAEDITSLRLEVDEHLRRISTNIEEHCAVRSDVSMSNLLALESQWFAIELAWRCKGIGENPTVDDPTSALHHGRALLRRLFAIGLERPMKTISPLGIDDSKDVYRVAELWICMMHMVEHWKSPSIPARQIPSFWDMLLSIAKSMDLHRFSSYNTAVSELLWTTIFELCSLSQFSVLGMTTLTPLLAASWPFVAFSLEHIRLEPNEAAKPSTRRKGDSYIRMLVSRCMLLNKRWHWKLDDAYVLFNRLLTIFKSRKFSNLIDEKSDFPSFLQQNKLEFLSEHRSSDSAFTLFLKLVVQGAVQANIGTSDLQRRPLPFGVKKAIQLVVPVSPVPFTKASPPTDRELSMLYNRFSAVAISIYLEPTPANTKHLMSNVRRYVNFANADEKTKVTCIRGFMQLSILMRHLKLPLENVLDWLAEITSVLIDEYRSYPKLNDDNVDHATKSAREATILHVGLVLGAVRRSIETPVMESNVQSTSYPDPALIDGPWITRIFSTETDLTTIPKIRKEVRRLVQEFLQARSLVIPKPARPRPTIPPEESQESQEEYNQFDFDLNDPELLAALEASNASPLSDDLASKERRVTELIDTHISPAIYRMVCKHFIEAASSRVSPFVSDDTDIWIDCWVGCASVLVQNGKRDWSLYFDLGPQSWERISDATRRRRVGLRFMFKVLELDPAAYKNHQDRFLEVFMESLVSPQPTLEHQYTSLLFSIDGLYHPFLQDIFAGEINESGDYSLSKEVFVESRVSWIEHILNRLSDALAKEGTDWARKATNQVWLGFLVNMCSAMRDALEGLPIDSQERINYIPFCTLMVANIARCPLIWYHDRIRSSSLFDWLQSQL